MGAPTAGRVAALQSAAAVVAPRVVELTQKIAAIPAPTGDEGERSRYVAGLFHKLGLNRIEQDAQGDVTGWLPGERSGKPVVVSAHLDTVFPRDTPLGIGRAGDRLLGAGIGDNSLGVAALLALPEVLRQAGVKPAVAIVLAANVGEEGLGNLCGIRAVMDRITDAGAAIVIEGQSLGRVTHVGVGSRRFRLTVRGPGGHSWGDYGRPSAIHALAALIDQLASLPLPAHPKTTFNVGLIEGGISVNTIAAEASCVIDCRSLDERELKRLAHQVERLARAARQGDVTVTLDLLGERPAGATPIDSAIVQIAIKSLQALGIEPVCDASSTDANIAISRGIPAVCIGISTGANAHRLNEYADIPPIPAGLTQLALTVLGVADHLAATETTP